MATYKTPGVYVEEISTMPPSVAEVETAIPAFFGFTQKVPLDVPSNTPKRISSLREYEQYFGTAEEEGESIIINPANEEEDMSVSIDPAKSSRSVLYYAMQLYFANGGGPCYIVSVGLFDKNPKGNAPGAKLSEKDAPNLGYISGLEMIAKEDEPTLLVFPDAPFSLSSDDYYSLMSLAIMQCTTLGDRFTIVDVLVVDPVDTRKSTALFRTKVVGTSANLKYAAAYFPNLRTNIHYLYDDTKISGLADQSQEQRKKDADQKKAEAVKLKTAFERATADSEADPGNAEKKKIAREAKRVFEEADEKSKKADEKVKGDSNNLLKNKIERAMNSYGVELSPCAAIAGVYANTDNTRGVWKAPANVSLNFVKSTTVRVTHADQEEMNIDVDAGKSINALRPFVAKGVVVWGARTLDGNDNEWRYINVRRFFNMVEESVKKSTYWAVFESNDINTWVKVRAMIENYLMLKWKDGALAGAKPDDAFFVRVGLGQTMTPQDVLEGRMIIEIGMAAVRPAEFIILKFSHKLQTT